MAYLPLLSPSHSRLLLSTISSSRKRKARILYFDKLSLLLFLEIRLPDQNRTILFHRLDDGVKRLE